MNSPGNNRLQYRATWPEAAGILAAGIGLLVYGVLPLYRSSLLAAGVLSPVPGAFQVLGFAAVAPMAVLAVAAWRRWPGDMADRLGLGVLRWRDFGVAAAWFPLFYLGNSAIGAGWLRLGQLAGVDWAPSGNLLFHSEPGGVWFASALTAILVAPWVEEVLIRNWLFHGLRLFLAWPWAAGVAAVLFAAFHLSPRQFPMLVVLSLTAQLLYRHTGNLWSAVWLHGFNNLCTVLLLAAIRLSPTLQQFFMEE